MKSLHNLANPSPYLTALEFSPDGGSLVTVSSLGSVYRWLTETWELREIESSGNAKVVTASSGRFSASTGADDKIWLRNIAGMTARSESSGGFWGSYWHRGCRNAESCCRLSLG